MKTKLKDWVRGNNINEKNRRKWISSQLGSLPKGYKILDAGAGELRWKKYCGHLRYVSQDFCEYSGEGNTKGLQFGEWDTSGIDIVSDITEIPVEDREFDAVLCTEVLEHLPHPEKAIAEFGRILRGGGELILTAPFCSLTHMAPYHFCTGFSLYWYETCLKENGFEIIEAKRNGDYFAYMQQELLRLNYIIKKYYKRRNIFVHILALVLTWKLKKYSQKDNESGELLCFGYCIRAKKI